MKEGRTFRNTHQIIMPLELSHKHNQNECLEGSERREELVRIQIQALRSMGYEQSAELLQRESGFKLESDVVQSFRECLLKGEWTSVLAFIDDALRDEPNKKNEVAFLVYEQEYLEHVHNGETVSALECLQTRLTPLVMKAEAVSGTTEQVRVLSSTRLHSLSSVLMCDGPSVLESKMHWGSGSNQHKSRMALLTSIQGYFPASLMMAENRLDALIHQAEQYQQSECRYHNGSDPTQPPSLLVDHRCSPKSLPRVTKHIFTNHTDEVWFVKFSNSGEYLAAASKDQTVCIWEVATYALKHTLRGHSMPISFVSWSWDDKLLLTCSNDKSVRMWDLEKEKEGGTLLLDIQEHTQSVTSCAWSPKKDFFISAGLDQLMCVWDMSGNKLHSWEGVRINDLSVTRDGKYLVGICHEKKIRIYDMKTFAEEQIQENDSITSLSVSADSKFLLVNLSSQEIHLWNLDERRLITKYYGQKQGKFVIRSCFGGHNDAFVISGSEDYNIYMWHRNSAELLDVLEGHLGTVNSVTWSPTNPRLFASCSDDKTVRLWGVDDNPSGTS
ncbi:hypothetical protein SARC_00508 [Sphaeroforma arctica JP610]|uniref:CTLH domain-containing protein n=1 Tax=Sphaeroforma arctica JP610 TaxID=667725 RepID=A0A0L0GEA8_9EUKA|nr:hypothetical protein SARC_00508 [Sphaeroforma arctica JP610]KNC87367.1 hypothetical protein SARC_00508 [Sphaeroforma arctica JP610]|eukprot:XP_014161269.1 hypothetical protein SARC_00508 [Sphaeroforma arctica JP610]